MGDDDRVRPPTEAERTAEVAFRVRFEESGPSGTIRASVLLRYAAELAWLHSERRGFGRSWYRERDLAWVVRGVDLRLVRPIEDGSTLIGSTRVIAARKVIARRRTEFRASDGELAALVDVDWAMTTGSGVPTRVPEVFEIAFGIASGPTMTPVRVRLTPPDESSAVPADARPGPGSSAPPGPPDRQPGLAVRRYELDPMGHVNNAVYLDWAEEAVAAAGGPVDSLPRRWRLEVLGAARPTSRIRTRAWSIPPDWSCLVDDPLTGERFVGTTLAVDAPARVDDPAGRSAGS